MVTRIKDFTAPKKPVKENELRINEQITGLAQIRLIGSAGTPVGIVDVAAALSLAHEEDLDLVEISPKAEPPVCKIMNYGKYLYEQQKKKQESKKKQKIIDVKEVQFRPAIDKHDLEVKLKAAEKFFQQGNKVKFVMRFRGREINHQKFGLDLLEQIVEKFSSITKVEVPPKLEGKQYTMVLSPAGGSFRSA